MLWVFLSWLTWTCSYGYIRLEGQVNWKVKDGLTHMCDNKSWSSLECLHSPPPDLSYSSNFLILWSQGNSPSQYVSIYQVSVATHLLRSIGQIKLHGQSQTHCGKGQHKGTDTRRCDLFTYLFGAINVTL